MSHCAPRCPNCATVLKLQPSFWERIGLRSSKTQCPSCRQSCKLRDARWTGAAYRQWAEHFRHEFLEAVQGLPVLSSAAAHRVLGSPHTEDTHVISTMEELVRSCLRYHQAVLLEMTRRAKAALKVIPVANQDSGIEMMAVQGSSAKGEGQARRQLIARNGLTHFVLYNLPAVQEAESGENRVLHGHPKPVPFISEASLAAMYQKQTYQHAQHA